MATGDSLNRKQMMKGINLEPHERRKNIVRKNYGKYNGFSFL